MTSEDVVFEGGPLDGLVRSYPDDIGPIQIPVAVAGEAGETSHRYVPVRDLDPKAEPLTASGARRYAYLGPAPPYP